MIYAGLLVAVLAFLRIFGWLVLPEANYVIQVLLGLGVVTFFWIVTLLAAFLYVRRR